MGFVDCLNRRCDIYRLQSGVNYDFTASEEGEVVEAWAIVSLNTKCRVDIDHISAKRRPDGLVELGRRNIYVDGKTDVRNGDRVLTIGEYNREQYEIQNATYIHDFDDRIHHVELTSIFTDWTPSVVSSLWIPGFGTANTFTRIMRFNYSSVFPKSFTLIPAGSWLETVSIQIDTIFDDPDAYFAVGYNGAEDNLIAASEVDITEQGIIEQVENIQFIGSDLITLYGNPGDSTQGSGIIFARIIVE